MKIYVIKVVSSSLNQQVHISQEAYTGIIEVYDFIKNRSDKPKQISKFLWESKDYQYVILELNLK